MELDIDVEKTLDKTREFLEKDLSKLASLADRDITSLSSPQLSFSCSHGSTKQADDILINHWSADTALTAIHAAAHHIPNEEHERDIFIQCYFMHRADKEMINRFVISRSSLRRRKNRALVEFARRLDVQKNNPNHNCDWLESLVVKQIHRLR